MDQIRAPASATLSAGGEDDRRGMLRDGIAQPGHRIVERLLSLIARRGGNAGNILRANGFDQPLDQFLVDTLPSLDMTTLQRLSSQASVAVSDLQARASGRLPFRGGDWRLLFYCLVGSRTLREAIVRMEELLTAIDGRMGSVSLKRSAGRASLIYTGARSGDEEMDFIVTLHGQLMFHAIFSWLIGKSLDGAVALDFPESARCYLDDELLPFDLALGAGQPEMTFAGTLLDQPVIRTMSDCEALPTLNFLFGLRAGQDPLEIVRRSRHYLALTLRERQKLPSLEELSRHLAIGPMTLRRRLHRAGTSFRLIRDELRHELAIDMLTTSSMSIEDIAERLDLCDSDALRRAFRGWTGMAPTEFRRSLVQRSTDG